MKSKNEEERRADPLAAAALGQSVAILVDGNNIERSIHTVSGNIYTMMNYDVFVPRVLAGRRLARFVYFREGNTISPRFTERLWGSFFGVVRPCDKSADVPLVLEAVRLANKVDTVIIVSGDKEYVDLVRYLRERGTRAECAGVPHSMSAGLKDEVDRFHEVVETDWFTYTPTDPKVVQKVEKYG